MTTAADQIDGTPSPTDQAQFVYLAKSLVELLETTKREFERDREAAKAWLATPARGNIVSDAKGQVPLQTSAEFVRIYNAQAHEIVDAITAAVTRAQAGLNWLRAEPPVLEEVRQVLNFIVSDGKRAAEIVIRLKALIEKVPTADAAL